MGVLSWWWREGGEGGNKRMTLQSTLVPGLQEPFKQAALGHLCAETMTGKRG